MRWKHLFIAAALFGAVTACSDDEPTDPGNGGTTVEVDDDVFRPSNLEIEVGETVEWEWVGSSDHNVAFDDGPTSAIQSEGSYQRQFDEPGTYPYHCQVHGQSMSGTIVVE